MSQASDLLVHCNLKQQDIILRISAGWILECVTPDFELQSTGFVLQSARLFRF